MPLSRFLAVSAGTTMTVASMLAAGCANERRGFDTPSEPASTTASAAPPVHTSPAPVEPPPAGSSARALVPLSSAPLIHLQVPGFGPAALSVPVGAATARPVVVALHGHAVRPEHACTQWSRASLGYAFVLCPHGLPADAAPDAAVTFGSAAATRAEIDAGLERLRAELGAYVADGPVVLAGYSMGARLAVELVHRDPAAFPRAAFGEGGYAQLTSAVAADLARNGVRVLLVCSTTLCEPTFGRARNRLERAGVPVRLTSSGGSKHMFEGAVAEATRGQWPWLVEGDPLWSAANP